MDLNWLLSILYKLASLITGLCIVYMGYKLFVKGIYGDTGEVSVDWNNTQLILKKAAPGSIFALFGAVVIWSTVKTSATYAPTLQASIYSKFRNDTELIIKRNKLEKLIREGNPEWEKTLDELIKDLQSPPITPTIFVDTYRAEKEENVVMLEKALEEAIKSKQEAAINEDTISENKS